MKELEKINNEIANDIALKVADYIKNLYNDVKDNLIDSLTEEEIKNSFKNSIMNEYNLKEIVSLNINNLNIIKNLIGKKNELGKAYSKYLIDKTVNKVYKILDKDIFNKKEKNKRLDEIIKEKKSIIENNKSNNIRQQKTRSI